MSTKICGSLNNDCQFLGLDGYCSAPDLSCEKKCDDKIFIYSSNHKHEIVLSMMRNLRTLHQENMEIKKLLSEIIKQNQK